LGARAGRRGLFEGRAELGVYGFADAGRFAARLTALLGVPGAALAEHRFPDGESLVRAPGAIARHAVLVRGLDDPNAKLVEVLLAADALRRAGASRLTLVAPYLPYMRQDAVFEPGEPNSQLVVGRLLAQAFDAVLTVEAHLHRVDDLAAVAGPGARSLSAAAEIRDWIERHAPGALVVGPDIEATSWTKTIATAGGLPWIVGSKQRHGDRRVTIDFTDVPEVRRAVIVDDIASSGATLAVAARRLRRHGIRSIDALVVHAIFAPGAARRIREAGVRRIVSSDTIVHRSNAFSVAGVIAAALAPGGEG